MLRLCGVATVYVGGRRYIRSFRRSLLALNRNQTAMVARMLSMNLHMLLANDEEARLIIGILKRAKEMGVDLGGDDGR